MTTTPRIPGMGPVMESGRGHLIGFGVPLGFSLVIAIVALILGGAWMAIYAVTIWLLAYGTWNFVPMPQQEFCVIERAGLFWRVKHGWSFWCMRGIIDRVEH